MKVHLILITLLVASFAKQAFADDNLRQELKKLVDKYGADSVAHALKDQSPKEATGPKEEKVVPEDAFVNGGEQNKGFYGFFIRRSYADVTSDEDPTLGGPADSYEAAMPAQFSYTHDFLARSDQWAVIGSIIRPFSIFSDTPPSSSNMVLNQVSFVPSVSIHRVTNSRDSTKDLDSVIFRAGLFGEVTGGPRPLRLMDLRLNATYATSSKFDGGIFAGEFDWEPVTSIPGNRTFYRLLPNGTGKRLQQGSLIEYYWRLYVHAEGGAADGDAFKNGESNRFFRAGPVAKLTVDPFFAQRLSASVSYTYLAGFSGEPADSHHFVANLGLILDPDISTQHWTLNATYEDGETPIVDEKVRTFLISLGIKY